MLARPFQLPKYQTDVQRCRFSTLGKSTPAQCAGAPTACERWVSPIVRSPLQEVHPLCGSTLNCSCTVGGPPTLDYPTHPLCSCTVGRGRFLHRYKPSSLLRPRVQICHNRHDRRSCKIFANCVNFPGKIRDFMHNMRRSTRFTHTMCDFALKLLRLYTLS